jgi:hypothetical protein
MSGVQRCSVLAPLTATLAVVACPGMKGKVSWFGKGGAGVPRDEGQDVMPPRLSGRYLLVQFYNDVSPGLFLSGCDVCLMLFERYYVCCPQVLHARLTLLGRPP